MAKSRTSSQRHKGASKAAKTAAAPSVPMSLYGLATAAGAALLVGVIGWGASQPTDWPTVALAACGGFAVALMPRGSRLNAYGRWPLVWAWAAWLAVALVSAVSAPSLSRALFGVYGSHLGWIPLAVVGLIVVAGVEVRKSGRDVLGNVALAVIGVEMLFSAVSLVRGEYVSGSASNSSILGQVFLLLLPIAVAALSDRPQWTRAALVAAVGVTLVLGTSWAALGALALWLTWVAATWLSRRFSVTVGVGAGVGVVALGGVGVVIVPALRAAVAEFAGVRLALLADAWAAFLMRPVLGWGPDGFVSGAWKIVTADTLWGPYALAGVSADPHNLIAWVLVSTGVVGTLAFGWIVFECGRNWFVQVRGGAGSELEPPLAGVALYAFLCLTTPAALQSVPLAALVLGMTLRLPAPGQATAEAGDKGESVAPSATGMGVRIAASVLVLLVGAMGLSRLTSTNVDRPQADNPSYTESIAKLWNDPFLYWRASIDWGWAAAADPAKAAGKPDLVAARTAVRLDADNPVYALELALTMAGYNEPKAQVESAFNRAAELIPGSPEPLAGLAEYRIAHDDLSGARQALDAAEKLGESASTLSSEAKYWRAKGDAAKASEFEKRAEKWTAPGTF